MYIYQVKKKTQQQGKKKKKTSLSAYMLIENFYSPSLGTSNA